MTARPHFGVGFTIASESARRDPTRESTARKGAVDSAQSGAFSLCINVLAEADLDLPFVLLYLVDHISGLARLVGETGVKGGTPHCPEFVDTRSLGDGHWAIGEAVRTGVAQHVDDVASRLAGSVVGLYPEQPRAARVLPIILPGSDAPAAVMIAGTSPRLPLDDSYRAFFDLVAVAVATALAGARAYEEAGEKLDALAQIDKAKTAFFSNVSHELRTPLTLILGPVEDALSTGVLGSEALKIVHRNALLAHEINNPLSYACPT